MLAAMVLVAGRSHSLLQFSEASFPDCNGPNIVVRVSWNAMGRKTTERANILVSELGRNEVVETLRGARGKKALEKEWRMALTFASVDASGRLLTMRT